MIYIVISRSSFLLVDMFCITLFISFCFYKFIAFDIFFRLCSIFLRSNSLTILINEFCNYICRRSSFLVDVFCISLFIGFCFYKFIAFDIFFRLCSIFFWSYSLTIFINVFCDYFWSWFYFLVDMFCITFFIFFSSYKFISFDIFFVFCSIFFWSYSCLLYTSPSPRDTR